MTNPRRWRRAFDAHRGPRPSLSPPGAGRRRLGLWGPVILWMAAIFAASSMSSPPSPEGLSDKHSHAFAYGVLSALTCRALAGGPVAAVTGPRALAAVAIGVGYGVTDEWHQVYVPGRTPDRADVVADATGAAIGAIAMWAWGIIRRFRRSLPGAGAS